MAASTAITVELAAASTEVDTAVLTAPSLPTPNAAAAAEEAFTVNNSKIAATDVIALSTTYAGAGTPILSVKGVAAGSFVVVISNVHASAALDALMVVNFAVVKAVAA